MELRHFVIREVERTWCRPGVITSLALLAACALGAACNKAERSSTQGPGPTQMDPEPGADRATEPAPDQPGAKMPEANNTEANHPALVDGAVLLFEKISLGNEPEANRRWRLDSDGTVWFSKNRPPVPEGQDFNQELSKLAEISPEERDQLLRIARDSGFWEAEEHQVDPAVEDGMRWQLTIRDNGQVRRIQADNIASPVIDAVTKALFEML